MYAAHPSSAELNPSAKSRISPVRRNLVRLKSCEAWASAADARVSPDSMAFENGEDVEEVAVWTLAWAVGCEDGLGSRQSDSLILKGCLKGRNLCTLEYHPVLRYRRLALDLLVHEWRFLREPGRQVVLPPHEWHLTVAASLGCSIVTWVSGSVPHHLGSWFSSSTVVSSRLLQPQEEVWNAGDSCAISIA